MKHVSSFSEIFFPFYLFCLLLIFILQSVHIKLITNKEYVNESNFTL